VKFALHRSVDASIGVTVDTRALGFKLIQQPVRARTDFDLICIKKPPARAINNGHISYRFESISK
jgi:hypothetical protein